MFQITFDIYYRLAEALKERFSTPYLYSGVIELVDSDMEIRFVSTLIPYFSIEKTDREKIYELQNIVPVWWEIHTLSPDGEVLNDFDFEKLKELLCL